MFMDGEICLGGERVAVADSKRGPRLRHEDVPHGLSGAARTQMGGH